MAAFAVQRRPAAHAIGDQGGKPQAEMRPQYRDGVFMGDAAAADLDAVAVAKAGHGQGARHEIVDEIHTLDIQQPTQGVAVDLEIDTDQMQAVGMFPAARRHGGPDQGGPALVGKEPGDDFVEFLTRRATSMECRTRPPARRRQGQADRRRQRQVAQQNLAHTLLPVFAALCLAALQAILARLL